MKNLFFITVLIILFSGCSPMQPAISDPGNSSLEDLPVKGRQGILINQKLSFGEFETGRVKRSWTRGGNSRLELPVGGVKASGYPDLLSLNYVNREQRFHFQMEDGSGNISDVYATSGFSSEDLQLEKNASMWEDILSFTLNSENLFYLQLFYNQESRPWQLVLDNEAAQLYSQKYQGIFALDENRYYTLVPITKVKGKKGPQNLLMGSIGYEIKNPAGKLVAAVAVFDDGNVYFDTRDPQERFLLANLCAALLLQENLADE